MTDDLAWLDGIALAELVRAGQVTRLELVEAVIGRIDATDPQLGFLVEPMYDRARSVAQQGTLADSPLAGVPMLLKDHIATHAGVRHTSGSRYLRDHVPTHDSELVRRYKSGGLIPVATTRISEFALLSTGESHRYGPCRNPWDRDRITGGSSGGSAAAVAAGVVPLAHGNDSGGSIRIPAAACGLFGLKPSRARNPLGPDFGDISSGLWAEHVLTRSVRDSAAALDITAGSAPGDPYSAPPGPPAGYLAEVKIPPGRLRIGYSRTTPSGEAVSPSVQVAIEEAAALCADLGHTVEEVSLPVDLRAFEDAFFVLYAVGATWCLDAWQRVLRRSPEPGELEPYTAALVDLGRQYSASAYLAAVQDVQRQARRIAALHQTYDLFMTPTTASAPVALGHFAAPVDDPVRPLYVDAAFAPFTCTAKRDRPAGDVGAAALDRRRPPHRHPLHRGSGPGGRPVPARRAARAGPTLVAASAAAIAPGLTSAVLG